MWKRQRRGKNCDRKVQLKYPSGTYHVPKTVFEQLEEEGIIVPEEARYFPYHATFDFERYFDQENLWALMQNMPTGSYTRRQADNEFKPKSSVRMAIEWLEWVAHKEGIHI